MKDFNIAKYLKEHNLGSHGILGKYVDLHGLKEDKDLGQQDAMPEPYEGPEHPIDGLGDEMDRDMDVSMNEEESELGKLTQEYQAWLDKNNLPQMSADELLYDENIKKTPEQKKYLQMFIDRWETAEEAHIKGMKEEATDGGDDSSDHFNKSVIVANTERIYDLFELQLQRLVSDIIDDGFELEDAVKFLRDYADQLERLKTF